MSIKIITPPAFEPVTLEEARLWCRITDTDEDAKVLMLITAMREMAEDITGRAFAPRTLEYRLDAFPGGVIELPASPLRLVESISYLDTAGDEQSLDASPAWWLEDTASEPGRVQPRSGTSWPATYDGIDAVRIRFQCGYASPNAVPKLVRLWMETRIATFWEMREQIVMGNVQQLPRDYVDGLLDSLIVRKRFA